MQEQQLLRSLKRDAGNDCFASFSRLSHSGCERNSCCRDKTRHAIRRSRLDDKSRISTSASCVVLYPARRSPHMLTREPREGCLTGEFTVPPTDLCATGALCPHATRRHSTCGKLAVAGTLPSSLIRRRLPNFSSPMPHKTRKIAAYSWLSVPRQTVADNVRIYITKDSRLPPRPAVIPIVRVSPDILCHLRLNAPAFSLSHHLPTFLRKSNIPQDITFWKAIL